VSYHHTLPNLKWLSCAMITVSYIIVRYILLHSNKSRSIDQLGLACLQAPVVLGAQLHSLRACMYFCFKMGQNVGAQSWLGNTINYTKVKTRLTKYSILTTTQHIKSKCCSNRALTASYGAIDNTIMSFHISRFHLSLCRHSNMYR
jgi:hypothetical protein